MRALDIAAELGRRRVVDLLLDRGALVNAANSQGWTPVIHAAESGHLEIVELLHARGANIHHANGNGENALHWAAWEDHLPVCEFLIKKGVDLMAADNAGDTGLSHYGHAVEKGICPARKALRSAALLAAYETFNEAQLLEVVPVSANEACERLAIAALSVQTVVPTLVTAFVHKLAALKAACVDLIKANPLLVMMSTPFIDLKTTHPLLWRELKAALGLPEEDQGKEQKEEQDCKRARREN